MLPLFPRWRVVDALAVASSVNANMNGMNWIGEVQREAVQLKIGYVLVM
jgi:hypothetical protein